MAEKLTVGEENEPPVPRAGHSDRPYYPGRIPTTLKISKNPKIGVFRRLLARFRKRKS